MPAEALAASKRQREAGPPLYTLIIGWELGVFVEVTRYIGKQKPVYSVSCLVSIKVQSQRASKSLVLALALPLELV